MIVQLTTYTNKERVGAVISAARREPQIISASWNLGLAETGKQAIFNVAHPRRPLVLTIGHPGEDSTNTGGGATDASWRAAAHGRLDGYAMG
jgi:hypothetical protein